MRCPDDVLPVLPPSHDPHQLARIIEENSKRVFVTLLCGSSKHSEWIARDSTRLVQPPSYPCWPFSVPFMASDFLSADLVSELDQTATDSIWEVQEGNRYRFGSVSLARKTTRLLQTQVQAVIQRTWGREFWFSHQLCVQHSHFLRYEEGDSVPPPHLDIKWYDEGQQVGNVLVYLSKDLHVGGETVLRAVEGLSPAIIQPSYGSVVVWRSYLPWGPLDPRAMHTARSVLQGTKIVFCLPLIRLIEKQKFTLKRGHSILDT